MADIQGRVASGYEEVGHVFENNFRTRNELGAAVAVVVENQLVVDLWGGTANPKTRQPWLEDTMVNMFSVTKGVAALAVAHAHSRISGRFPGFRAMRMQTTSLMKPTLSNWLVHGRP
jgi:hypothetical protein